MQIYLLLLSLPIPFLANTHPTLGFTQPVYDYFYNFFNATLASIMDLIFSASGNNLRDMYWHVSLACWKN